MKSESIPTDRLIQYLKDNGFGNIEAADYSKAQLISLIKDNEATANRSNNGLDAKAKVDAVIYGKVETDIIKNILDKIYQSNLARIKKYPTQDKPTANIVTGPPGAGKNYAIDKVIRSKYEEHDADNENHIKMDNENYISGDNIKEDFQKAVQASDLSPDTKAELDDSSFVHRLTSEISWKLFDDSKELKKNFILEMLGMWPEDDAKMYLDLEENGYDVNIINVLTTTTKSIDNAINRYFSMGGEDGGRYVGITHMAMTHKKQLIAFIETMRILKKNGSKVDVNMLDNSMLEMLSIYFGPVGDMNIDELDEMFDRFLNIEALGSDLWFTGDNHAVDLSLFSHDEDGDLVVALIKRGQEPFKDSFALPGGFVNTESVRGEEYKLGYETHEEASKREFLEETGLPISSDLTKIGYYDDPARDPRNVKDAQVVSTAYSSYVDTNEDIIGLDDASEAKWVKVSDISSGKMKLAFDHSMILNDSLEKMSDNILKGKRKNSFRKKKIRIMAEKGVKKEQDIIDLEEHLRNEQELHLALSAVISLFKVPATPYESVIAGTSEMLDGIKWHHLDFHSIASAFAKPFKESMHEVNGDFINIGVNFSEVIDNADDYIKQIHALFHDKTISNEEFQEEVKKIKFEIKSQLDGVELGKDMILATTALAGIVIGDNFVESMNAQIIGKQIPGACDKLVEEYEEARPNLPKEKENKKK